MCFFYLLLGVWEWQLRLDYADKYKEELPADWLKIIDTSPCIQLEKSSESYIVTYCKPGDVSHWMSSCLLISTNIVFRKKMYILLIISNKYCELLAWTWILTYLRQICLVQNILIYTD